MNEPASSDPEAPTEVAVTAAGAIVIVRGNAVIARLDKATARHFADVVYASGEQRA